MTNVLAFRKKARSGRAQLQATSVPSCAFAQIRLRLREAGLRPTRQRVLLGLLLFGKGDRHVSAEALFQESRAMRAEISLATIYNTLKQFSDSGLLRKVASIGDRAIFDTNTGDHHHFLVEEDGTVFDMEPGDLAVSALPAPPAGYRIAGVDVVVRLEHLRVQTA